MKPDPTPTGPDVESLVKAYLDTQARSVDPDRILSGIRARGAPRRQGRAFKRWGAGIAAAAGLLMAFTWNFQQATARADAVQLVREARSSLDPLNDRAYRIGVELAPGVAENAPFLAILARFEIHLWTGTDRLLADFQRPGRAWSCGFDEHRRVWIAPSTGDGLLFEPEEIPPPIGLALDLCRMDLETLLDNMLVDFDLTAPRHDEDLPAGLTRIRGTLKSGRRHPRLRSIAVVIDDRTKLVRRVTLARIHQGRPLAEVSFELEETRSRSENRYRLASHLAPDAPVHASNQPIRRRRELRRFLGSLLDGE